MSTVRYIVADVAAAKRFYVEALGFAVMQEFGDAMAIISRGDLKLWLAGPMASASKPMPDGRKPESGGWNRIVVEVDDIDALVAKLKAAHVAFRNEPFSGPGGTQVLIEDPSGNPIEIFQARGVST
ncbi:VOC family protein [Terrarubrum flagellatum]|uniref:VOC family protein n=1 Tax=Terrirubrum flagellatum TaxID=2895980 RepID=UPI00314569AB